LRGRTKGGRRHVSEPTVPLHRFSRTVRIAWFAERNRLSTREALERVAEVQGEAERRRTRREFLGDVTRIEAAGALASAAGPLDSASAKPRSGNGSIPSIAIVGAGLAGLTCADRLRAAGVLATVYEAAPNRVGGRVRSLPGVFPGRTIELGGELIDYSHETILGYVKRFGLTRIDLFDTTEDVLYRIDGATLPESRIIDGFRDVVLRADEGRHALGDVQGQREELRPRAGQRRRAPRQHEPPGISRAARRRRRSHQGDPVRVWRRVRTGDPPADLPQLRPVCEAHAQQEPYPLFRSQQRRAVRRRGRK